MILCLIADQNIPFINNDNKFTSENVSFPGFKNLPIASSCSHCDLSRIHYTRKELRWIDFIFQKMLHHEFCVSWYSIFSNFFISDQISSAAWYP